ncbi:MAG: glycosyltransferase [Chloroflexota bacterium]|jgi:GT2 family glycosyltransferase
MTRVAAIVPSLHGTHLEPLLAALRSQTRPPDDIIVIRGVSPNGRARNAGVTQTDAEWLLFIDDDAIPGHVDLIERLLATAQRPNVVAVGSARLLPPDAPPFQRHVADQVARIVHPVVGTDTITNPDPPHFYCDITTTCLLMHRTYFDQIGGFDESLIRGVDTEFLVRLRRISTSDSPANIVQSGDTWVYHPAPSTLSGLWRKHVQYGIGHAQEVVRDPTRARGGNWFATPIHAAVWLLWRTLIVPIHCILPYSFADPRWRLRWAPLKALSSYASALGYIYGWYRYART